MRKISKKVFQKEKFLADFFRLKYLAQLLMDKQLIQP